MSEKIEWFENQIIWDSLDALVKNCSTDLKNLLDALWEHRNEIDENTNTNVLSKTMPTTNFDILRKGN